MSGEEVRNKKSESLGSEVQARDDEWYVGAVRFVTTALDCDRRHTRSYG